MYIQIKAVAVFTTVQKSVNNQFAVKSNFTSSFSGCTVNEWVDSELRQLPPGADKFLDLSRSTLLPAEQCLDARSSS